MPRLDLYLNSISRFGATGAVLSSGGNVTLRFPAGDRFASQTTTHTDLVGLVEEVAPPRGMDALKKPGGKLTFGYAFNGKPFTVKVDAVSAVSWTVALEPGEPPQEPRAAPPPTKAASGGDDLQIERTSYESVGPGAAKKNAATGPAAAAGGGRGGAPKRAPSEPAVKSDGDLEDALAAASAVVATPTFGGSGSGPVSASASAGPTAASGASAGNTPIEKLLVKMKELGASDLHLSTGSPPLVRLHGEMKPLPGYPAYTAELLQQHLYEITPHKNKKEFEERHDSDFAHAIPGVSRFRVNYFRDRKGIGAVFRAIPFSILSPEQLGIPKGVLELCFLTKGLVLVTGPTGSGKSTTLATLVDYVNEQRADHIITIEDPIEFVHENKKCLVNQREVHAHTRSFKDALRAALREDPDVVLVGELRDLETIAIAVETAETGHLVFGTLHTTTAPSTIDRVIDQFPSDRQEQIRQMLSESLRGVIAQTLCKKIGGGRVAAYEILIASSAVSNLIREKKTFQLFSLMQTGRAQGMITMNDSLIDLVKRNIVEPKEAFMKSVNKAEFKNQLAREGIKVQLGEEK